MNFIQDCFHTKGNSHDVCEDYALSGKVLKDDKIFSYAIVCDGCSSAVKTDVGATILAHAFESYLKAMPLEHLIEEENSANYEAGVYHKANEILKSFNLPDQALYTTVIIALAIDDRFFVKMYGDGNIVALKNGEIQQIINISFGNNMPYYFAYEFNGVKSFYDPQNFRTYKKWLKCLDDDLVSLLKPCNNTRSFNIENFHFTHFDQVVIFSDGIESFDNTTYKLAINEFCNFKMFSDDFIQRRSKKFLSRLKHNGIDHYDDFSVASIKLVEE